MLRLLQKEKLELFWLLLHVIFAILSVGSKFMVITWFYVIMISITFQLLTSKNTFITYLQGLAYIMGFEMWSRLAHVSPFIPVELGKYYPLYFGVLALLKEGKLSFKSVGWWIILLTIPSVLIFDTPDPRHTIPFQYFGILNLALFLVFFHNRKIQLSEFSKILKLMLFPLVTTLIYTLIKAPDYDEATMFGEYINRNELFVGGAAPNQVSTYFGVGFLLLFTFYLLGKKVFVLPYVDKILMALFMFQALMTFSRGGVIGAILSSLVFWIIINFRTTKIKFSFKPVKVNIRGLILMVFFPIVLYFIVDTITKGSLTLRYTGKSSSVQQGARELDADYYTSGRLTIAGEEFLVFLQNPILGVGLNGERDTKNKFGFEGQSRHMTHWEFSRLLAEHGSLGLIVVLILLFYPISRWRKSPHPLSRAYILAFWTLSIGTMFHAAMRTVVPPLFYGLIALTIVDDRVVAKKRKISLN